MAISDELWNAGKLNSLITTPKLVLPTTKITEIQRIMHNHKIHTVLVVDEEKHLLGVVDHYACMV